MQQEQMMGIRVALADDDDDSRAIMVRLLERLGYEVACAVADGSELVEQLQEQQFDLALVDLDMPILDGLATAEEVTQQGIPVILISGHPDAREIIVDEEPIVATLQKPILSEALQEALELALAARE